jgi:hypothetical protein
MNHLFTIAVIVLTTIIGTGNCNEDKVPEISITDVRILVNLLVNAFFGSTECYQQRNVAKCKENFYTEKNGKYRITKDGLKILKGEKYPCKIQLQIGQLEKHNTLKTHFKELSNGKPLWDGNMDYGKNISARKIRGDLVAEILNEVEVNYIFF